MAFWDSKSGQAITGKPEAAFVQDFFLIIPNGTKVLAKIDSFKLHEEIRQFDGSELKEYRINWKITEGEFRGREVVQKIKAFDEKPEACDRALNMLKLIMDICKFVPTSQDEPTTKDLAPMVGKVCGVKIREWHMPKKDGSGMMEGNFISEVWSAEGFEPESGVKMTVKSKENETAFDRNPRGAPADLNDDIPF